MRIFSIIIITSLLLSCNGIKQNPKPIYSVTVSNNMLIDPNPPKLKIVFPFNIHSFKKPNRKEIDGNTIITQTLLTDDLSKFVYIHKMELSSQTLAQADITASNIENPLFLEEKKNGYCVLFFNQDIRSNNLEGRILKHNKKQNLITIRIIKKLYDDKPDLLLTNNFRKDTLNICRQVFLEMDK